MVDRVVVVDARPDAGEAGDLQVDLRGVERTGRGVGVLGEQPLRAQVLAEVTQDLTERPGVQPAERPRTPGGGRAAGQQRQQVALRDRRLALVETVGLAGEGEGALRLGGRPAGQVDGGQAGQLGRGPHTRVGQLGLDLELALLGLVVRAVAALVHQGGLPRVEFDTGDEVLEARPRVVLDQHGRVPDPVVGLDGEPDLVELHPEAAQLHLVVGAAGELDGAVGVPVGEVAGAEEPPTAVRVPGEALLGQVRPVQVAARHLDAADGQFADLAHAQFGAVAAEDPVLGAVGRGADGDRVGAVADGGLGDHEGGGVDGALGRPVEVDQLAARQGLQEGPGQGSGERLATGEDLLQRVAGVQLLGLQQGLEQRRDALEGGDAVRPDRRDQPLGVPVDAGTADHDGGADRRGEDLPLGGVEADRRLLQHDPGAVEAVRRAQPGHLVGDAAVLDHHALGPTGAARGVDDVGQRVGGGVGQGDRRRRVLVLGADDHGAGGRQRGQPLDQPVLGDDHLHAGVLDHEAQAFLGVLRGQRQIGAAREEDRPGAGQHLGGGLDEQPHALVRGHSEAPQVPGQCPAPADQFGEGQPLVAAGHRRVVGALGGGAQEQFGQ